MRLTAGTVLADRYRLTALLGEGGMGEVWAARHVLTGKAVAVKHLTCGMHERHFGEARARFAREAQSACAVDHSNVVEVFDFVEALDRSPIMVMELLQGETLAARLARGPLAVRELARTLLPVVSAVGTAHTRGIVHRDLKPSNIFLDVRPQDGCERVKVLDFGIAKWLARDGEDHGLRTRTGSTLGTPSYMAPEQATGDRTADHRVDIWSLGVILYEACSGVRPLEGENAAQLVMRLLSSGIMPIEQLVPELPTELATLISRMLARDVARRPADLREVYVLLRDLAGEESVPFGPPASARSDEAAPGGAAHGTFLGPRSTGVDAFARTLEPALAAGAIERRPVLGPLTRTAQLVPDALVALETNALAAPKDGVALPASRPRWVRPLGLVALAMATAWAVFLTLRAGTKHPVHAALAPLTEATAAVEAPSAPSSSMPLPRLGAEPSAAPAPQQTLGSAGHEAPPPVVVVNSLPHATAPASHAARPRHTSPRERRRSAAAPAPHARAATGSGTSASEDHPATAPEPPSLRTRGAECESSSECASRLCVAYVCQ